MRVLVQTRNPPALQSLLPCVAPLAALAIVVFWSARDGGFPVTSWYPGGVAIAALLAVQVLGGATTLPPRWATAAIACVVAYAGFELASILWASSKGSAWDSANRTFVYAFVLVLFAASAMPRAAKTVIASLVPVSLAVVGIGTLFSAANHPAGAFLFDRLSPPTGYANATAALFLIPFWAAVALAGDPHRPTWVRGPSLGAAGVLAAVALVPESRGAVYAAPVVAVLLLVLTPYRIRTALALAVAVAPTAILVHTFTRPYSEPAVRAHATREAAWAALVVGLVLTVLGVVLALADRRFAPRPPHWYRYARLVLAAVAVAAAVALVVAYVPRNAPHRAWESFRSTSQSGGVGGTRLLGNLGSNRYDFWRVALDTFANHPLAGIGSRGFRAAYLLHRRSPETPARSHSVELDALSETGIVGFLLLAAALVAAAAAVGRRARSDLVSAAALGAFACWLAHASVDWTWSFPAIGVPVFVLVGTGAAGGGARLPGRVAAVLAAAAAALAIGAFGLPWLSARYVRAALDGSTHARADLQHARTLDPLSLDPLLAAWALAPTPEAGLPPLVTAARREPRSPDMLYLLGRQQVFAGRARAGVRTLERALRLDPGDPTILAALRRGRRAHRAATPRRATSSAAP